MKRKRRTHQPRAGLEKLRLGLLFLAAFAGLPSLCPQAHAADPAAPVSSVSSPTPVPAPQKSSGVEPPETTPEKTGPETESQEPATATPEDGEKADESDEVEIPFVPHWTGQIELTYSTQPDSQGQPQDTSELSMTGIYNLLENNTYVSLELTAGQESLEGSPTNYGTLTGEGGLGIGIFQPILSIAQQRGAAALNSTTATLNLNFQVLEPLTLGPLAGAGVESHQGPVSSFSPLASRGDAFEEGDSYNWDWGAQATYEPSDFFSTSLTFEDEYDKTYQFQNVLHTVVVGVNNQYDRIVSLTLATDFTFWKDVALDLSLEEGEEYQPAGVFYSPVRHRTLFNAAPTEQNFTAYIVGMTYSIE